MTTRSPYNGVSRKLVFAFDVGTIIYYDRAGSVRAAGAEAGREGIDDIAEDGMGQDQHMEDNMCCQV